MKRKHSKWTWADSFKAAKAGKRKRDSIETDQQAKADIGSWPKPTPKRGETTNG